MAGNIAIRDAEMIYWKPAAVLSPGPAAPDRFREREEAPK